MNQIEIIYFKLREKQDWKSLTHTVFKESEKIEKLNRGEKTIWNLIYKLLRFLLYYLIRNKNKEKIY